MVQPNSKKDNYKEFVKIIRKASTGGFRNLLEFALKGFMEVGLNEKIGAKF
jgi:hypothetical protein